MEDSIGEYLEFQGMERMTPITLWRPEGLLSWYLQASVRSQRGLQNILLCALQPTRLGRVISAGWGLKWFVV